MQYKVVMTDTVYPDFDLEREKLGQINAEFIYIDSSDEDLILEATRDADALITCYAQITKKIISGLQKCRSISKTGIGVNNIDIECARTKGIIVTNVTDYCIEEVSDHALALALCLIRRIYFLARRVENGTWSIAGCENIRRSSTLCFALMGFGRIARRVCEKIRPFGMRIIAYDPYVDTESMAEYGVCKVDMDELYSQADIISLHLPLNSETAAVIDAQALKKMKSTAYIINTSRGPLIDESALYYALKNGEIAAAALDVISNEKYDPTNPLFTLENTIITPHAAFCSVESTQELRKKILDDVINILKGNEPKYRVV